MGGHGNAVQGMYANAKKIEDAQKAVPLSTPKLVKG